MEEWSNNLYNKVSENNYNCFVKYLEILLGTINVEC